MIERKIIWLVDLLLVLLLIFSFIGKEEIIIEETNEIPEVEEPVSLEKKEVEIVDYESMVNEEDVIMIAKTLYGECRGVKSDMQKAGVAWCVLNRVDSPGYGETIAEVITSPHQFAGYRESNPLDEDLVWLAKDILIRWYKEKDGIEDVGRVLPLEYRYFGGDGKKNYFRSTYRGKDYWDWSLPNPYAD